MAIGNILLIACTAFIILSLVQRQRQRACKKTTFPLPPGPPSLPIIGNALDMPSKYQWLTFAKWAKKYGDIMHIELFGQHVFILDSATAVRDLLERRSAIYSDKPRLTMINDLLGWTWAFSFMRYGEKWRQYRRLFHQHFYAKAVPKYSRVVTEESRKTLLRLIRSPDDFLDHLHLAFASISTRVVYGIKIESQDHPYYRTARKVVHGLAETGDALTFFLDALPILRYVPHWVPGAGFKRRARKYMEYMDTVVNWPFEVTKNEFLEGKAESSVVRESLSKQKNGDPADEEVARHVAAIAYTGGSDTSVSTLQTFFLAMLLYPEVQRKAQEQIDQVVGRDRLPEFSDLESLPYLRAIFKELIRWQPVLPLAALHTASCDDIYRGYRIPKGSLMIGNSWSILHDKTVYRDPMKFYPERFLKDDGSLDPQVQDPAIVAFGFGRRICPGRHFAEMASLITLASVLATLDIDKPNSDTDASSVRKMSGLSNDVMTTGLLSYPQPFKCSIKPRTGTTLTMIENALKMD